MSNKEKKEARMRELLSVHFTPDEASAWMKAPCRDFGNRTPEQTIKELGEKGIDAIVELLEESFVARSS